MNKKTWKPYAAIVLILLYGVDIFWLSGFCVYYFGEWGIPMYEGLLAVLALGIVVLFREDVKRAFPFHRPDDRKDCRNIAVVDRNPSDHDDSDIDPALCISGADEWGYRKCE